MSGFDSDDDDDDAINVCGGGMEDEEMVVEMGRQRLCDSVKVQTDDGIVRPVFGLSEIDREIDRGTVLTPEMDREIDRGTVLDPWKEPKKEPVKVLDSKTGTEEETGEGSWQLLCLKRPTVIY
jgi:hypothetical protein